MQPSERERLRGLRPILEARDRLHHGIRDFFRARGYLEVETPLRIAAPAPELHIDAEPSGESFLRTSPELHMKRLLAAGYERLFQLGPCFRRGERGAWHHPEYTMLEWYRAGADYRDILEETRALLLAVAGAQPLRFRGQACAIAAPWVELTVSEAFLRWAGWDPVAAYDPDRFDLDLVDKVEPALPAGAPVILRDYPAGAAALARRRPGRPEVAERWELYLAGLELANAYSELTDPEEQAARFTAWSAARARAGRAAYPPDAEFLAALRAGLPACAGVALGVDRLLLAITGGASLDDVLPFRDG